MRCALLTTGLLALATTAAAQGTANERSVVSGVMVRGYDIDGGNRTTQLAVPIAVVIPVNSRFAFDIGTYYASTSSEPAGGSRTTFSGLTDTQLRASYMFGQDAVVTTLMVNLPTGSDQKLSEAGVTGAASANFLSFPVNSYRNGLSVTGGVAVATQLGAWNVGLAGSVRLNNEFTPFSDDSLKYTPGTEGRVKLGVDRLIGSSRLQIGFTWSTFGNDAFTNLGGGSGSYQAGDRLIGEATLTFLAGSGTLSAFVWNYYRSKADGASTSNQENIFSGGLSGHWPLGRRVRLIPVIEGRLWSPDQGNGRMFGAGASVEVPVGDRFVFSPGARFDLGRLEFQDGTDHNLTGWGLSALLRYRI
ncbi:MAG: hypothetical protein AB7I33_09455 [Gemmatimonadales bacterium]